MRLIVFELEFREQRREQNKTFFNSMRHLVRERRISCGGKNSRIRRAELIFEVRRMKDQWVAFVDRDDWDNANEIDMQIEECIEKARALRSSSSEASSSKEELLAEEKKTRSFGCCCCDWDR